MIRTFFLAIFLFGLCLSDANFTHVQAQAPDGSISFHLKVPKGGCRHIDLSFSEKPEGGVRVATVSYAKSELTPGQFSKLAKFNIPAGEYKLIQIYCHPKKTRYKNSTAFKFDKLEEKYENHSKQHGLDVQVLPGFDVYLGALDPFEVAYGTYTFLTIDRSAEAISKGQLSAETLKKSFVVSELDHEALLRNAKAALVKQANAEADDKALKATINAKKPSKNGRGEIAMHIKSDFDCVYIEVGFVGDNVRYKNIEKKTQYLRYESDEDGLLTDFATKKVKSGRYRLTGFKCGLEENGRYLKSASLIRSQVDVYPKDIAYVGELYLKKTKDNTDLIEARRRELELKHPEYDTLAINRLVRMSQIAPFEFAMKMSDRTEDARTRVNNPEKLVKRSFDATNYDKQANSSMRIYAKKVLENRVKSLSKYAEALAQYDETELVKP